jgi:hypothetical protein
MGSFIMMDIIDIQKEKSIAANKGISPGIIKGARDSSSPKV